MGSINVGGFYVTWVVGSKRIYHNLWSMMLSYYEQLSISISLIYHLHLEFPTILLQLWNWVKDLLHRSWNNSRMVLVSKHLYIGKEERLEIEKPKARTFKRTYKNRNKTKSEMWERKWWNKGVLTVNVLPLPVWPAWKQWRQ